MHAISFLTKFNQHMSDMTAVIVLKFKSDKTLTWSPMGKSTVLCAHGKFVKFYCLSFPQTIFNKI